MPGLTLITPTSDRAVAFEMCERWMHRALQQVTEPVQWIVVDDGRAPANCTLGQTHLRRPCGPSSEESFLGNLRAGLEQARHDKILFIEDDDWYREDYLRRMSEWLEQADLTGEAEARYYHLAARRYLFCRNRRHASLCQTGIRAELLPRLLRFLEQADSVYVDLALWRFLANGFRTQLHSHVGMSIGIKGLPGKTGLGVGHRLSPRHRCDPTGALLRDWIGPADAALYFQLFESQAA